MVAVITPFAAFHQLRVGGDGGDVQSNISVFLVPLIPRLIERVPLFHCDFRKKLTDPLGRQRSDWQRSGPGRPVFAIHDRFIGFHQEAGQTEDLIALVGKHFPQQFQKTVLFCQLMEQMKGAIGLYAVQCLLNHLVPIVFRLLLGELGNLHWRTLRSHPLKVLRQVYRQSGFQIQFPYFCLFVPRSAQFIAKRYRFIKICVFSNMLPGDTCHLFPLQSRISYILTYCEPFGKHIFYQIFLPLPHFFRPLLPYFL